ncbi:MAG: hypothetical protein HQM06_07130 [Magnetococcales bacterium]|nr:hypothetical protein [Magnetococcales bacterium]
MKHSVAQLIVSVAVMCCMANAGFAADAGKNVDCKSDKKCEELQKAATKK